MATTSAAILSSPTPSLLAHQGLRASVRGLRWNNFGRNCFKKDSTAQITAKFELKPPPYALDALEPHMSRETLEYHWGKHHRIYVENLNKQIEGTDLDGMTLEDIIVSAYKKGNAHSAFNNAAQAWNHKFFWESMKPGGGGKPSGELLRLIKRDFGSFEGFVKEFRTAATSQFGSGWAWLTYKGNTLDVGNSKNPCPSDEDKKLVVVKSPNAINPLIWNHIPLLTIDVWEHAYYLDFENGRPDYISIFLEKLVSWETVSARLEEAEAKVEEREREQELREKEEEDKLFPDVEMVIPSDEDESELSETETETETKTEAE